MRHCVELSYPQPYSAECRREEDICTELLSQCCSCVLIKVETLRERILTAALLSLIFCDVCESQVLQSSSNSYWFYTNTQQDFIYVVDISVLKQHVQQCVHLLYTSPSSSLKERRYVLGPECKMKSGQTDSCYSPNMFWWCPCFWKHCRPEDGSPVTRSKC